MDTDLEFEAAMVRAKYEATFYDFLMSDASEEDKKKAARDAIEALGSTDANRVFERAIDKQRALKGLGPATKPDDPAYALLMDGRTTTPSVHRDGCYICEDPEFAQMGLPLCKPCEKCSDGHVAADDTICDLCGWDIQYQEYICDHLNSTMDTHGIEVCADCGATRGEPS